MKLEYANYKVSVNCCGNITIDEITHKDRPGLWDAESDDYCSDLHHAKNMVLIKMNEAYHKLYGQVLQANNATKIQSLLVNGLECDLY